MKNKLLLLLISISSICFADDFSVEARLVNHNLYLGIKNNTKKDIIITWISEYVNNDVACGNSNIQYSIKAESSTNIIPFSVKDMARCFDNAYIFKAHFNGTTPKVLGFYDPKANYAPDAFLSDWSAFIVTPLALKFTYNIDNQTAIVSNIKYLVYKISE